MACKEGQFDVVELMVNDQFKTFSINLNAQHVNGMTPFDLALSTVIRYSRVLNFTYLDVRFLKRCYNCKMQNQDADNLIKQAIKS